MNRSNRLPTTCFFFVIAPLFWVWGISAIWANPLSSQASPLQDPGEVLRALVRANAEKDLETMKRYMGQNPEAVGYTIGGRKFIGWDKFAITMEEEFASVVTLEIPITELVVWRRGDVAWFAMELDYIREVQTGEGMTRTTIPLRETGVLERRNGQWSLVNWHESLRQGVVPFLPRTLVPQAGEGESSSRPPVGSVDLSGKWEIQEEDKSYQAILDVQGNGTYNWKNGTILTTDFSDGLWKGDWSQTGNDREGGFEVLLSEDGTKAEGVWWYTRVGTQGDIPPKITGGTYIFQRLTPVPSSP